MAAEIYIRPQRGQALENEIATAPADELKAIIRDLTEEVDALLCEFVPAHQLHEVTEDDVPSAPTPALAAAR